MFLFDYCSLSHCPALKPSYEGFILYRLKGTVNIENIIYIRVEFTEAVFNLVWSYGIKAVDGCKKARCTCDGSTRSGQVRVLDETYANCVDQTSARLFYGIAAAENLIVYGADVSNAFAEAPPPKQGFYIHPDEAFLTWWTLHKQRPSDLPMESNSYVIFFTNTRKYFFFRK